MEGSLRMNSDPAAVGPFVVGLRKPSSSASASQRQLTDCLQEADSRDMAGKYKVNRRHL